MASTDLGATVLWLIIIAAGIGTFALRASFVALWGRLDDVPPEVEQALRLVPAAVLSALVVPQFVLADGQLALSPGNPQLLAGAVAALVAWRTEDILATLVAGMGALWLVTYLIA
jgi:branched-subunit amino acid transport protein